MSYFYAAALTTRRHSGITSFPMPSPAITAILCVFMVGVYQDGHMHEARTYPDRSLRLLMRIEPYFRRFGPQPSYEGPLLAASD